MNNTKRIIERDEEVIFHNWTDKDFTGVWIDGPHKVSSSPVSYSPAKRKVYELTAGKSYYLPFYLAEKFAKEMGVPAKAEDDKIKLSRKDLPEENTKTIILKKA